MSNQQILLRFDLEVDDTLLSGIGSLRRVNIGKVQMWYCNDVGTVELQWVTHITKMYGLLQIH